VNQNFGTAHSDTMCESRVIGSSNLELGTHIYNNKYMLNYTSVLRPKLGSNLI